VPAPLHQPFYCEENIWHLAQDPRCGPGRRLVLVISGTAGRFAMWKQRAAPSADEPLPWDYHVVLLVHDRHWQAWDLDTALGAPIPAEAWLAQSFPHQERVRPGFRPRFRVLPAAEYVAILRSDRAHMRDAAGGWQHPPPPWPPPGDGGSNVLALADVARPTPGTVLDRAGLVAYLAAAPTE
jgi:hypothetical protein